MNKKLILFISILLIHLLSQAQTDSINTYFNDDMRISNESSDAVNKYFVEEINGNIIYGNSVYVYNSYLLIDDKKIELSDVISYQDKSGYYVLAPDEKKGFNVFAKRIIKGRIAVYKYNLFRRTNTYYIKDNAETKALTYKNLKIDLIDNQESMKYLYRSRIEKNIAFCSEIVIIIGIIAITIAYIPLDIFGVSAIVSYCIFTSLEDRSILKAIKVYNRNAQSYN
jgi:hypothetical protein